MRRCFPQLLKPEIPVDSSNGHASLKNFLLWLHLQLPDSLKKFFLSSLKVEKNYSVIKLRYQVQSGDFDDITIINLQL